MFKRIVVGTDGSETAAEAVRQAIELAKATGAALEIVSAYEPVSRHRLREESGEIPGDIAHSVGPREDVNVILEARRRARRGGRGRGQDPCPRGRPRRRDPRRRRGDQGRPGRGRQQGHDRRPALPARQRAEQDLPPRSLRRLHRPHHLAGCRRSSAARSAARGRSRAGRRASRGRRTSSAVPGRAVHWSRSASRFGLGSAPETPLARTSAATPLVCAADIEVPRSGRIAKPP